MTGSNFHPQFPRSPLLTPVTMISLLARTQARLTTYFSDLCFKSLASNFFFFFRGTSSFFQLKRLIVWQRYWNKRALSIIFPSPSYDEALNETGIPTIISYCEDICDKVFNPALCNKDNKLNKLLTEVNKAPYLLRNHRYFALPKWKRTVLITLLLCHRA